MSSENTTRRKMAQPRPPWNSHMKDSINYRLNPKDQVGALTFLCQTRDTQCLAL